MLERARFNVMPVTGLGMPEAQRGLAHLSRLNYDRPVRDRP